MSFFKFRLVKSSKHSEAGTALSELAISLPFIVMLICGVINFGMVLERFLVLNQVCYEGVRYAASLPQLEITNAAVGPNEGFAGHDQVIKRIRELYKSNLMGNATSESSLSLTDQNRLISTLIRTKLSDTENVDLGSGSSLTRSQVVEVVVTEDYEPVIPIFPFNVLTKKLSVHANGPYLFREQNS